MIDEISTFKGLRLRMAHTHDFEILVMNVIDSDTQDCVNSCRGLRVGKSIEDSEGVLK